MCGCVGVAQRDYIIGDPGGKMFRGHTWRWLSRSSRSSCKESSIFGLAVIHFRSRLVEWLISGVLTSGMPDHTLYGSCKSVGSPTLAGSGGSF